MVEEMVVVVKLDRVTFSLLEVKMMKLEPGSVVFMLSWPCMEKTALDGRTFLLCKDILAGHHNFKGLFGD